MKFIKGWYQKQELALLKHSEFNKNIIVSDGTGNKTKTLDLNEESIPVMIDFLKAELKRVTKNNSTQGLKSH